MPTVTVGRENSADIQIHYEDHGAGQPVVLIHGYPLSGRAKPRDAPGQRLIKSTLRCALQDLGHLGQQVVPAPGELAERGHRRGLLVAGEFTPPSPSPVMSQQPDHLPKLAPVVS